MTTKITVRSTKSREIDTTTPARTGLTRRAAGGFQPIPRLVLLPDQLRLLPIQRTTKVASVREIAKGISSAVCALQTTRNNGGPRELTTTTSFRFDITPSRRAKFNVAIEEGGWEGGWERALICIHRCPPHLEECDLMVDEGLLVEI